MKFQSKTSILILCAVLIFSVVFFFFKPLQYQYGFDQNHSLNAYSPNIEIKAKAINTSGTKITSCIDLPTNEDWIPDGVLKIDDEITAPSELTILDIENVTVYDGTHRCYEFLFPVQLEKSGKFVVRKVSTTIPDLLSQEECDKAMAAINESNPGMIITCKFGDHGVAFDYVGLPKGTSENDAATEIRNALSKTISGPWSVEIQ